MKRLFFSLCQMLMLFAFLLNGCGPKSVSTGEDNLQPASKAWIPFNGNEVVVFTLDTMEMVFTGKGKETYYEHVRYKTDQGGFFSSQEDYYGDLERQELIFESPSTHYFVKYYLERNKGDMGDWDIFMVSVGDGDYYQNEMKIVTYETSSYDKGEDYTYQEEKMLNNIVFDSVYYKKQERRPFEVYYTKRQGVVGFKVSSTELWTIRIDTLSIH